MSSPYEKPYQSYSIECNVLASSVYFPQSEGASWRGRGRGEGEPREGIAADV